MGGPPDGPEVPHEPELPDDDDPAESFPYKLPETYAEGAMHAVASDPRLLDGLDPLEFIPLPGIDGPDAPGGPEVPEPPGPGGPQGPRGPGRLPRPPDPADFDGAPAMYAFKKSLYELLDGVHRRRLAGRLHMGPSALSRTVNMNLRITEERLNELIAAVRVSERTPPTPKEIVDLRTLHARAEREADSEDFTLRGLRVERDQAVRRRLELEDTLSSARAHLGQLRARTEQALREDGERSTEDTARLAALEARVRDLERAVTEAVQGIIALEKRLTLLEQRLPDLGDPSSMPALADDPLRAAQILAAITDESERIATAGRLIPELAVPAGVLTFYTELHHMAGAEVLIPVVEESLLTMPVGDLAALLVAASSGDVVPEDEEPDEDRLSVDVRDALHGLMHQRLEARTFAALVHLLEADSHPVLATALLTGGAQGPVPDVLEVSAALRGLAAPYLQEAALARPPQNIAELVTALRTEERDPDAHTVLHTAGRRLQDSQLAQLTDLLTASGRTHDLRELQEGTTQRHQE
ncbi:hypothetical protein ACWCQP_44745 [Streptomyces chartreusis]